MRAYDLNTRFNFGKYEGKTLEEVFRQDPSYVEKCMVTVEDFAVDEKTVQKLFEHFPNVVLSSEAVDTNLDKLDAMDFEGEDDAFGPDGDDEFDEFSEDDDADEEDDMFDEDGEDWEEEDWEEEEAEEDEEEDEYR